jgi:hypothetical protein
VFRIVLAPEPGAEIRRAAVLGEPIMPHSLMKGAQGRKRTPDHAGGVASPIPFKGRSYPVAGWRASSMKPNVRSEVKVKLTHLGRRPTATISSVGT